jgi:DNA repair photolyase
MTMLSMSDEHSRRNAQYKWIVLVLFRASVYYASMRTLIDRRDRLDLGPTSLPPGHDRGRGARSNESSRHERLKHHLIDDGWESLADLPALKTSVTVEAAKSIITRNRSPDISFDRSINPYQGCEHGCSYCYARPTHANFGLSPGLDFESKLFAKTNAAELLRKELAAPGYRPATIALGANTDPYQPIERRYRITRQVLEVLADFGHPVGIVTKSALVVRDLDILQAMAERNLVKVAMSLTTLDPRLARAMEPRASMPAKRLQAMEMLAAAGVPTTVMVAPVIPALNDAEIEAILKSAAGAGAREAGYVLLRLPLEVRDIFCEWLASEFPERASHVLSLMRSMRQGRDYDATWGRRQTGTGPYAWSIGRRFEIACRRLGLNRAKRKLSTDQFRSPARAGDQLTLL